MTQIVTIMVGLPGSGKTKYLQAMNALTYEHGVNEPDTTIYFDDFHGSALDNSSAFFKRKHYQNLSLALAGGRDCILSDVAYCCPERLRQAVEGLENLAGQTKRTINVKFIFFRNDPERCKANARRRFEQDRQRNISEEIRLIESLSSVYSPPNDALPVFRPD